MRETMERSADWAVVPPVAGLSAPPVLSTAVRLPTAGAGLEGGGLRAGEAALGRSATVLLLGPFMAGGVVVLVVPPAADLGAPPVLPAAVCLATEGAGLEGGVLRAEEAALVRSAAALSLGPSAAGWLVVRAASWASTLVLGSADLPSTSSPSGAGGGREGLGLGFGTSELRLVPVCGRGGRGG